MAQPTGPADPARHTRAWRDFKRMQGAAALFGVLGYAAAVLHAWEVAPMGDVTALEVLADALDPEVVLEVDAYWAAVGGADVPALLAALGDRVVALHLKDAPLVDDALSQDRHDQLPVGDGAIEWTAILDAAPSARLLVVEFDEFRGDIFDGAATSLAGIRTLTGAR